MFGFMKTSPAKDPTALLNILVHLGWLTAETAHRALLAKEDKLIGQTLLELGLLTEDQLEEALFQQQVARGKVSIREVAVRTMRRQNKLSDKVLAAVNDLHQATRVAGSTGKFATISRKP